MNVKVRTVTTKSFTLELNAASIRKLLRDAGLIPGGAEVNVAFRVPSGGDYSGEEVMVDHDSPVVVSWETTEEEQSP